jgi:hypothetical protein
MWYRLPVVRKGEYGMRNLQPERKSLKVKTHIKAGPDFQVGDEVLTIDEDGFIQEPDRWNEDVAAALAKC